MQTDPTDGVPKHTWRVSDSVTGTTKNFRSHYRAYDPTSYGCQVAAEGVVWDIAEWISGFAGNDPLPLDLITQKIAPVGNDQADLLSALQDLCQENTTPAPTTTAPPTVTPAAQTSTVGTPARWSVSVSEDPSQPTTLLFDYGD